MTNYNTIGALATSIVRTLTPMIGGWVITLLAGTGINIPEGAVEQIVVLAISALYYLGARLAETYGSRHFGWLLGLPAAPVYPAIEDDEPVVTGSSGFYVN